MRKQTLIMWMWNEVEEQVYLLLFNCIFLMDFNALIFTAVYLCTFYSSITVTVFQIFSYWYTFKINL